MSTKDTPLRVLKAKADKMASILKKIERGEKVDVQFPQRIEEAKKRETFKTGIIMDDKVVTIELSWTKIRETSEPALSDFIVKLMRETRTY